MAQENRNYIIIPLEEVENIDFDLVIEDSAETLRISEDGKYTFVKFEGNKPSFLNDYDQYTYSEIKNVLDNVNGIWYIDDDEAKTFTDTLKSYVEKITWSKYNPFNWL